MHVLFTYSLLEEIKNIIDIIFHKDEYKNMKSIVYPSVSKFIAQKRDQKEKIAQLNNLWPRIETKFNVAIGSLGLKYDFDNITCFVHTFGCEGWCNVDKNQIHIRTEESSLENIGDSIIHEIIHLVTYKKGSTFNEREQLVDKYMSTESIQNLLTEVKISANVSDEVRGSST